VTKIDAQTSNGETIVARLVNYDARNDIALLKLESGKRTFQYVPLWGAGEAIEGETVVAIGNPYGLSDSITMGIVSKAHREMKLPNNETFPDLIQVSATINPGNSGGPLFNINGQLLGINAAIRKDAQGIAFAIPTRKVADIVSHLMGDPPVSIDQLGLKVEETRAKEGAAVETIVRVSHVEPNSPAARHGFKEGDELAEADQQRIGLRFDLNRILWARRIGEEVKFRVQRSDSASQLIELTLQLAPAVGKSNVEVVWQKLGIWGKVVAPERVRAVQETLNGGLLVLAIAPNSLASKADLKPGDILVGVGGYGVTDGAANLRYMMGPDAKEFPKNTPLDCMYIRDGAIATSKIVLPTNP
jgi:serine protease Do